VDSIDWFLNFEKIQKIAIENSGIYQQQQMVTMKKGI
jgi:hypothetical protein